MPYQAGSSAQRIRIGLTGLAFAFLLVLLGSIISRSSRDDIGQRSAAGRDQRAERAAGRARRRARRVGPTTNNSSANKK